MPLRPARWTSRRGRGQPVAAAAGRQVGDRRLLRDRALVVAVAGEGEGAVGEGEDEAAMGDAVAIQHVVGDGHGERRLAGCDPLDPHAEALRGRSPLPTSPRRRPRPAPAATGRKRQGQRSSAGELRLALLEEGGDALRIVRQCGPPRAAGRARDRAGRRGCCVAAAWMARLVRPRPRVGPAASRAAMARASSSSAASSTAFQIRPQLAACFGVERLGQERQRLARAARRGSRASDQLPPASGTRPIFAKAWMNFAERAARTMSQANATLAPAPAATPLTAQTTGFSSARIRRRVGL